MLSQATGAKLVAPQFREAVFFSEVSILGMQRVRKPHPGRAGQALQKLPYHVMWEMDLLVLNATEIDEGKVEGATSRIATHGPARGLI